MYPYVEVWRHEIWTLQRMAEFTALGNKAQHVEDWSGSLIPCCM